jgi:hypothetical protein
MAVNRPIASATFQTSLLDGLEPALCASIAYQGVALHRIAVQCEDLVTGEIHAYP